MSKSCASSQQVFALCTKVFVGVVSLSIFGGNFVLAKVCLGFISCLLYTVERCMLPGGLKCVSSMAKSIGAKWSVRCREVVSFLEGSLLEVLLYCTTYKMWTSSQTIGCGFLFTGWVASDVKLSLTSFLLYLWSTCWGGRLVSGGSPFPQFSFFLFFSSNRGSCLLQRQLTLFLLLQLLLL